MTADDVCYFLGEYTARKGYAFSKTNDVILNFKKSLEKRGTPEWRWKLWAIETAAATFRTALDDKDLNTITFVPVPPSKARDDPLYDDRLIQMLRAIRRTPLLDVRELVIQTRTMLAAHESDRRPTPEELESVYTIDQQLCVAPPRAEIAIVDDVLTTGLHFRAMKSQLTRVFPAAKIVGMFIARRAPETMEIEDPPGSGQIWRIV
ncbi:MAG: hypothetical protein ACYDAB_10925 [bacterium]